MARAALFWRTRNAVSARASRASLRASMAMANRAALAAPASPMAKVATGTPRGICTMEYRESCPARWREGTGTPSTGTMVLAASMPGRWAAPPAPAMIACKPRPAALAAYANISSGVRCAESTWHSCGTANSSSTLTAACITSQSLALPMTTPTAGLPDRARVFVATVMTTGPCRSSASGLRDTSPRSFPRCQRAGAAAAPSCSRAGFPGNRARTACRTTAG